MAQFPVSLGSDACISKVELRFQCRNLMDKDVFSLSDPMIVTYVEELGRWKEISRTEVVKNNLNPEFATTVSIDYFFEKVQKMKFEVYDIDNTTPGLHDDDYLGHIKCTLGEIVSSGSYTRPLLTQGGSKIGKSTITIYADEIQKNNKVIHLSFKGTKLDKMKYFFGKADPFLEIRRERDGKMQLVHRTEVIKNTLNPVWKPFEIKLQMLGGENVEQVLLISCFNHNGSGYHDLIGEFRTTVSEILEAEHRPVSWPCINEKKKKRKGSSYQNSGVIHLVSCKVTQLYTFLDYIFGGTQLNFIVAIDFTGSNGDPRDPKSLHYISPNKPNQYTRAIWSVGNVIRDYDSDKMFPALGFGAKIPPAMEVSHEFALNFDITNPYCAGIEGILDAYHRCLPQIQLYGPTNFSPIINHAARFARHAEQEGSCNNYFVLLIITDGVITDMDNTVRAIIEASYLPLSIIIVGVGKADFSAMDFLDSDGLLLTAPDGTRAVRDIIQFVPFLKYEYEPPWMLAKEVLAELPDQVTGYFRMKNIPPKPRPSVPVPT